MRQIVDGVFEVSMGYVHAHLIVVDDGVVLVDTGLPKRSAEIGRALFELRRKIGEVNTILLTHHHPDHVGGHVRSRTGGHRAGGGAVPGVRGLGGRWARSPPAPIRAATRTRRRLAGASRCGAATKR